MRGRTWSRRWRRAGRRSRRLMVALGVTVFALAGAGTVLADVWGGGNDNPWPYNDPGPAPVVAAVGDIACQPGSPVEKEKQSDVCDTTGQGDTTRMSAQTATANQIEAMQPNLVAILGDEQYQVGRYQDFMGSFDHTYGAFKFLQRPSPGNHEFYTSHGETGDNGYGYFDYYNGYQLDPAGNPVTHTFPDAADPNTFTQPVPRPAGQAGQFGTAGDGWYSYNLGAWHIISLNAECATQPGGCSPTGSWVQAQTQWLAQDLRENRAMCTMAYWHQPTFSSTNPVSSSPVPTPGSAEGTVADAWWKLLYAHHADLVLNGHEHLYARFAPMDPAGNADPRNGISEFIVGTGGEGLDTVTPSTPNLRAWADQYYGTMKLTLAPGGYRWDYESALRSSTAPAGTPASYSDTGSARCHGGGREY
ncbi:MAG TPA: metallophosphoesterase [Solirubrobacteraceae bacterium]|nr:metallophosphoesterase [Solirubrobacteraceae bacterium]